MKALANYLLFYGFGLCPIWISTANVVTGFMKHPNDDGNAALPWVIVIALPWTLVTVLMAKLIGYIYSQSAGDLPRDLRFAHATTAIVVSGVFAFTVHLWTQNPP